MKKLLIAFMALTLCIALVACGGDVAETTGTVENEDVSNVIAPNVDAASIGGLHWASFESAVAENPKAPVDELAGAVLFTEVDGQPLNKFMGGVMPLEVGTEYFPGFDNYAITGYKTCANFMPMMGSIAYVGYIFELEDGADVQAFINTLTENCNPRWNICVTADQTVAGAIGNKVFFLMCPATYELPDDAYGVLPEDSEFAIPEDTGVVVE